MRGLKQRVTDPIGDSDSRCEVSQVLIATIGGSQVIEGAVDHFDECCLVGRLASGVECLELEVTARPPLGGAIVRSGQIREEAGPGCRRGGADAVQSGLNDRFGVVVTDY